MSKYNAPSKDAFANSIFNENLSSDEFIALCMMATLGKDYEPRTNMYGENRPWNPADALEYWIGRRLDCGLSTEIYTKKTHYACFLMKNGKHAAHMTDKAKDYINASHGYAAPSVFNREALKKKVNMLIRDFGIRRTVNNAIDEAKTEFEANNIVLEAVKKN